MPVFPAASRRGGSGKLENSVASTGALSRRSYCGSGLRLRRLRSKVTARRPLVGLIAVPVCAFVGCAAIRCCSYVPPGRTPSLAELASGANVYTSVAAILRLIFWGSPWFSCPHKRLRSGLAGDGFIISSRWPFWNFVCVETRASQRNAALLAHLLTILLAARESVSSHLFF
jgi:hypothetical protein